MTPFIQAEYERLKAWETEGRKQCREWKPDPVDIKASVVVKDTRPNHHYSCKVVAGLEADVKLYVGWLLETDTCTPHYEHMLWRLNSVTEQNGLTIAELSKSHYAGD